MSKPCNRLQTDYCKEVTDMETEALKNISAKNIYTGTIQWAIPLKNGQRRFIACSEQELPGELCILLQRVDVNICQPAKNEIERVLTD
jgi:hypothetical protein